MMALTFQYHVEALDFITKDDPRLLEQRLRDCLLYTSKKPVLCKYLKGILMKKVHENKI